MKNLLMCFVLALVLLPLPQRAEAITKLTWTMADTLQYPAGRRVIHAWVSADTLSGNVLVLGNFTMPNGKLLDAGRATIDTLNTFLMVAGQRAATKYVASDTLRTDLITGLTDTNTGLSWLGPDSLALVTGGTARVVVGSTGNIGIGIAPNGAWGSSFKVFQMGGNGLSWTDLQLQMSQNAYTIGSGIWNYLATGAASRYEQVAGTHAWYSAPSGTAGTSMSPVQLMTLSSGGRFALGSTDTTAAFHYVYRNIADALATMKVHQDNASGSGIPVDIANDGSGSTIRAVNAIQNTPFVTVTTAMDSAFTGAAVTYRSFKAASILDDTAGVIFRAAGGSIYGKITVWVFNTTTNVVESATIALLASALVTPSIKIESQTGGNIFEVGTAALSGTTGTDNKVTIGAGPNGAIYFENRIGATVMLTGLLID